MSALEIIVAYNYKPTGTGLFLYTRRPTDMVRVTIIVISYSGMDAYVIRPFTKHMAGARIAYILALQTL